MSENTSLLEQRYGHTVRAKRLNKSIGIITAAGFTAVLGLWLWWGGVLETPAQLNTRELGYVLVSDREVDVKFEVTAAPGTTISCAVQALNSAFGIVGWKIIEIPPATTWTRTFQETLMTSEPAVTGLLYECWVA
jgi:hypothetical protein